MLRSIKISELHYCSLICYWLVHTILAASDDNGSRFGHHCWRRTSPNSIKHRGQNNKLISTYIYWIYWIALAAASEQTCARPPTPQAAWVHQIHVAGGVSGSTTMAMVIGRWLCFLCVLYSWLVSRTHPTYVLEVLQSVPPRLAQHHWASGQPWVWLCLHVDVTNPLGIDVIILSKIQS